MLRKDLFYTKKTLKEFILSAHCSKQEFKSSDHIIFDPYIFKFEYVAYILFRSVGHINCFCNIFL